MSENCPLGSGDNKAGFKSSLLRYLQYYEVSAVQQFITAIERCDMSSINTAFISSVPGSHKDGSMCLWGHRAVAKLLRTHVPRGFAGWEVVAQCSSIGSLGPGPQSWLESQLGASLGSCRSNLGVSSGDTARVSLLYPTHQDVLSSYDGPLGGGCLPYSRATASKQPWLHDHLCCWRAAASERSRAPPHIKTYTRISPDNSQLAFFMLTSANLSRAAWGTVTAAGNSCTIMSYEAGVVWLPTIVTGDNTFPSVPFRERPPASKLFPLHYDLPLTRYTDSDKPWLIDYLT